MRCGTTSDRLLLMMKLRLRVAQPRPQALDSHGIQTVKLYNFPRFDFYRVRSVGNVVSRAQKRHFDHRTILDYIAAAEMASATAGSSAMLLAQLLFVMLVCVARGQDHVELTLGQVTEEYTVPCNEYKYFKVDAVEPCEDLRIQVTHVAGEPDIYVSRGPQMYPKFNSLAWSSYQWGSESLVISSWDPEYVIGTYYIGILAYCGTDVGTGSTPAQFTVLAEHTETNHPHDEIQHNGQVDGSIAAEGYRYYRFCVPSSCNNVDVRLENCLDPATCPTSYSYPELLVSRSIQQPSINSHSWKLATTEIRSISLTHDDPDFYPGHYFVGVYGWCTPDNLCSDLTTCGPCSYANDTEFVVGLTVEEVTEGCTPKQPLELCGTGGVATLAPSLLISLASLSILAASRVWLQ